MKKFLKFGGDINSFFTREKKENQIGYFMMRTSIELFFYILFASIVWTMCIQSPYLSNTIWFYETVHLQFHDIYFSFMHISLAFALSFWKKVEYFHQIIVIYFICSIPFFTKKKLLHEYDPPSKSILPRILLWQSRITQYPGHIKK